MIKGCSVLRYHLKELTAEKEFSEKRRITIGEVADETGLNRMTLSKMINHPGASVKSEALDRLCTYFDCQINSLVTHIKDSE